MSGLGVGRGCNSPGATTRVSNPPGPPGPPQENVDPGFLSVLQECAERGRVNSLRTRPPWCAQPQVTIASGVVMLVTLSPHGSGKFYAVILVTWV